MKLTLLAAMAGLAAAGVCDTSTCLDCNATATCGWFGTSAFSDCRVITSVPASLASTFPRITTCPTCQAGNCERCQNQSCTWFSNSIPGVGGECTNGTQPGGLGTWTTVTTCPACIASTTCTTCYTRAASENCAWYELPGGGGGRCAAASPGFAYTKKANGFCAGNPCAGQPTCTRCRATIDANNNTNVCSWYDTKISALHNSKCDQNSSVNVVSTAAYDERPLASTCPVCAGVNCGDCKAETGCKWVAVDGGILGLSFGQCVATATTVTGKTTIAVCPSRCEVFSCAGCIARQECRWYVSSAGLDPECDVAANAPNHPFSTETAPGGTCPAGCQDKANRCYECGSLTGCGWYKDTIPGIGTVIPGTGDCKPTASPGSNTRLIAITDKNCDGNPNSAALAVPGMGLALGLLMFF